MLPEVSLKRYVDEKGRIVSGVYEGSAHPSTAGLCHSIYIMDGISEDEDTTLDIIVHPCKAEATIWLIEEAHRRTTSSHHIAKLWQSDPMHDAFVDPIFPEL
ncbi:hypothetical protein SLEP1_g49797 [Rubroshorea leprosula]|uniref:Uncharacterized protein n=1 Tax=Rubroshorea leprosula TaxID=152421 RepID=A0AAV5LZ98_9ROSI|nr:hypothetical protein SLEP1_g49797 [Rubroshorea leprosula]